MTFVLFSNWSIGGRRREHKEIKSPCWQKKAFDEKINGPPQSYVTARGNRRKHNMSIFAKSALPNMIEEKMSSSQRTTKFVFSHEPCKYDKGLTLTKQFHLGLCQPNRHRQRVTECIESEGNDIVNDESVSVTWSIDNGRARAAPPQQSSVQTVLLSINYPRQPRQLRHNQHHPDLRRDQGNANDPGGGSPP